MKNCQAKTPATCRIHSKQGFRPVTHSQAKQILLEATRKYEYLENSEETRSAARREMAEAQFLVYTTPEGQEDLQDQINSTSEPELKNKFARILDYAKATRLTQEIYQHELENYEKHPADKYASILNTFGIHIRHYNALLSNAEPYKRQRAIEEKHIDPTLVGLHGKERHIHMKTMAALSTI